MSFTEKAATHPRDTVGLNTDDLRDRFTIDNLFAPGEVRWTYCPEGRLLLAGICPTGPIALERPEAVGPEPLLERREMGIVNLGESGTVEVGGKAYTLAEGDALYIGRGSGEVTLSGDKACFYAAAVSAHQAFPTRKVSIDQAKPMHLGEAATSNERTIYLYIAPDVTESCQLMMGFTKLKPGSVWNTMPCHLHRRRMEVYLYCDLPEDQMVVHLMGEPQETRSLLMRDKQAVISPSWSVHCGAGTSHYSFVWTMVGENQAFADMAAVATNDLR